MATRCAAVFAQATIAMKRPLRTLAGMALLALAAPEKAAGYGTGGNFGSFGSFGDLGFGGITFPDLKTLDLKNCADKQGQPNPFRDSAFMHFDVTSSSLNSYCCSGLHIFEPKNYTFTWTDPMNVQQQGSFELNVAGNKIAKVAFEYKNTHSAYVFPGKVWTVQSSDFTNMNANGFHLSAINDAGTQLQFYTYMHTFKIFHDVKTTMRAPLMLKRASGSAAGSDPRIFFPAFAAGPKKPKACAACPTGKYKTDTSMATSCTLTKKSSCGGGQHLTVTSAQVCVLSL